MSGTSILMGHGMAQPLWASLRYSGQKDDLITWSVPEEISGQAALYAHDRGPAWLSPAESQVRMFAAEHPEGQTLVLHAETAPRELPHRDLTGFCDSRASGTVSGALGGRLDFPAFLGLAAWGAVVSGLKSPA
ncbi:hypothetical protein JMK10_20715, partial [Rhodovulum sulfidophilum]|uniref:hypothetical protein n=1 Tax=Rhodovulum sulfidophilum TaxID=35806 RepID=UPI001923E368